MPAKIEGASHKADVGLGSGAGGFLRALRWVAGEEVEDLPDDVLEVLGEIEAAKRSQAA